MGVVAGASVAGPPPPPTLGCAVRARFRAPAFGFAAGAGAEAGRAEAGASTSSSSSSSIDCGIMAGDQRRPVRVMFGPCRTLLSTGADEARWLADPRPSRHGAPRPTSHGTAADGGFAPCRVPASHRSRATLAAAFRGPALAGRPRFAPSVSKLTRLAFSLGVSACAPADLLPPPLPPGDAPGTRSTAVYSAGRIALPKRPCSTVLGVPTPAGRATEPCPASPKDPT